MLVFVQVCRTIDKNLVYLWSIDSDRTNESNGINKKEAWSIWRKRFWRQAALKKLTSSEAPLQKQFSRSWRHQRFWRSSEAGRRKNFKCCSNEDWITPIIAEDRKSETTDFSNGFEDIGCLFSWEHWKRTFVRSVQPLSPLLCFCVCKYKNNSCACNGVPPDLEWIWNWSFIGQ